MDSLRKPLKYFIVACLALAMLAIPASCIPADAADLIESLLENTDGGEMTFKTSEGETVTVTITREGQAAPESSAEKYIDESEKENVKETVKETVKEKEEKNVTETEEKTVVEKKTNTPDLADYLPTLNCKEDVFKTLGVWDDAEYLRDMGLTWSHIAEELGYHHDKMYAEVEEIIEESLREARDLGLITQEQLEYKYQHYNELALKWINKIYAE